MNNKRKREDEADKVSDENMIIISRLPYTIDKKSIKKWLYSHEINKKNIIDINIPKFTDTDKPKGIVLIKINDTDDTNTLLKLNNQEYKNKKIKVKIASRNNEGKKEHISITKERPKDCKTIFVKNLYFVIDKKTIEKEFSAYGELTRINMPLRKDGNNKG